MFIKMHIKFFTFPWNFRARAVLLGAMTSVESLRRPSAADVRPGTELYETIIRALRGEHQWERTSDSRIVERRCTILKECGNSVANGPGANCSESLPSIETPPLTPPVKRPYHVHNTGQTTTVDNFRACTVDEVPVHVSNTTANSTIVNNELSSEQNVATPVDSDDVQCAVLQKLEKISQVEKTCTTKTKPHSKYKPPYKIEKSHKPITS